MPIINNLPKIKNLITGIFEIRGNIDIVKFIVGVHTFALNCNEIYDKVLRHATCGITAEII